MSWTRSFSWPCKMRRNNSGRWCHPTKTPWSFWTGSGPSIKIKKHHWVVVMTRVNNVLYLSLSSCRVVYLYLPSLRSHRRNMEHMLCTMPWLIWLVERNGMREEEREWKENMQGIPCRTEWVRHCQPCLITSCHITKETPALLSLHIPSVSLALPPPFLHPPPFLLSISPPSLPFLGV